MDLNEAIEILTEHNYIMEDYEEQVARKRFAELEGLYEIEGDEAKEFDTNFPVAKIEHGRLMMYRPIEVESLAGENVAKLSIPYKWVDVTEYDEDTWERVLNYTRNFRKTVEEFEYALNLHKAALVKNLDILNKIAKV